MKKCRQVRYNVGRLKVENKKSGEENLMKTLITGIAGGGKSTILAELRKRGYSTLDLDTCGACEWVNRKNGARAEYREGVGLEWIQAHQWRVVVPKLVELLSSFGEEDVFVGGKAASEQMEEIRNIFDAIYLLMPNDAVIHERLSTRTNNHFAKTGEEREAITAGRHRFEEICLAFGATPLNNHGTVEEVVNQILRDK